MLIVLNTAEIFTIQHTLSILGQSFASFYSVSCKICNTVETGNPFHSPSVRLCTHSICSLSCLISKSLRKGLITEKEDANFILVEVSQCQLFIFFLFNEQVKHSMDYATGILSFFLHCLNSFTAQASRFNFVCILPYFR